MEDTNSQTSESLSESESGAAKLPGGAKRVGAAIWSYIEKVGQFYWTRQGAIREYLIDFVPLYRSHRLAQHEIRLFAYQTKANASFDESGWRVRLPEWCVVCGNSDCKRVRQKHHLERLRWTIVAPIAALLISITIAALLNNPWMIPLVTIIGFPVGYHLTGKVDVRIEYYRCSEHREAKEFPAMRIFGDQLIIRTGNKSIRGKFLDEGRDQPGAPT